jgi:hypothetical protein
MQLKVGRIARVVGDKYTDSGYHEGTYVHLVKEADGTGVRFFKCRSLNNIEDLGFYIEASCLETKKSYQRKTYK